MTDEEETAAQWKAIRVSLDEAQIDLSDYSDEYAVGFAAGWEHARHGVGSDGLPFTLEPIVTPLTGSEQDVELVRDALRRPHQQREIDALSRLEERLSLLEGANEALADRVITVLRGWQETFFVPGVGTMPRYGGAQVFVDEMTAALEDHALTPSSPTPPEG